MKRHPLSIGLPLVAIILFMATFGYTQVGLWVSTGTGLTTAGTVEVTSSSANALTLPNGGAGGTWTFTGGRTNFDSAAPLVYFHNTNASANNRRSRFIVNSGQFAYQMLNDDESATGTVFTVERSAHTPTLWTSHVPIAVLANAGSVGIDLRGRAADNISQIGFRDAGNTVQFAALVGVPAGFILRAGGVDHAFTSSGVALGGPLSGVRVNSQSAQPGFLAIRSTNVAGNQTLVFDSEVYDETGAFNNTTGVFTAPVTGRYHFDVAITCADFADVDELVATLVTTARSFRVARPTPAVHAIGQTLTLSVVTDLSVGQTAHITTNVAFVDVAGATSPYETWFSGRLVG